MRGPVRLRGQQPLGVQGEVDEDGEHSGVPGAAAEQGSIVVVGCAPDTRGARDALLGRRDPVRAGEGAVHRLGHAEPVPQNAGQIIEREIIDMGEGQLEEDVAAVDVPVGSGGVVQRLAGQEFVQRKVGAAVMVESGGGPKSPEGG